MRVRGVPVAAGAASLRGGVVNWWEGRLVGLDLETTAPDPEEARIVTAAFVVCGGGLPTGTQTWLADPGVEIPEEATAVHGITTERARADGRPMQDVLVGVLANLHEHCVVRPHHPLVIFNARYDLTVLDREARRHGCRPLGDVLVVDPFVIDKWLDRYRKGSRKLDAMCAHYGATLDGAHDASFDALAACRVAWAIAARAQVVRRAWNEEMHAERLALHEEWERVRHDVGLLHEAQRGWALAERDRFAEYKRSVGEHEEADRIEGERGWPVLELAVAA